MKPTTCFEDTIAAISTPVGAGGIGVIKVSGTQAWAIGRQLFHRSGSLKEVQSHRLYYGHIVDPDTKKDVDEVLVGFMRAPTTYTREDVVEINCHSGLAVLNRILELVIRAGARLADPGEFTRRAFINGRIDLTQAEAVLDVINSKTKRSLDLASEHLSGGLYDIISAIRNHLLDVVAIVEAAIDFPEEDLELLEGRQLVDRTRQEVQDPIERLLEHYEDGRILREGLSVIIAGKPNVGKSSLLNNLLRSNRALVTPIPGTTRDIIEESLSLRGIPLRLVDTAGLRQADNLVEKLGMEFTRERLAYADLVLFLLDRSEPLTEEDRQIYKDIQSKPRLVILNKIDLAPHPDFAEVMDHFPGETLLEVSALRGDGVDQLKEAVCRTILGGRLDTEISVVAPNLRHKICLEQSLEAAKRALGLMDNQGSAALVALELQEALAYLGEIVGLTTTEDLLDQIFNQFCVGK
jgi:tRNA modification GTPase